MKNLGMPATGTLVLLLSGCTAPNPQWTGGGDGSGGSGNGAAGTPRPGGPGVTGGGGGGGSGGGGAACYSEAWNLSPSIDDLKQAFQPGPGGNWLATSLTALDRRQPGGHQLLDSMKSDPQLPGFVDSSSFENLMTGLMTICHEETTGYDYDNATASTFTYYMTPSLTLHPTAMDTFPRSEILPLITSSATRTYDQTFLQGQQGSYGLVEMMDELDAYTNGLGCITAVGDQVPNGISARDGAVAHLLYLELYLEVARLNHPTVYATLKGDAGWQKAVRYGWARVHFWAQASAQFAQLAIADQPIWSEVNDPANLMEIQLFTGEDPAVVACSP